ncbi:hypothetical protein [Caballeronia glathei]|uniref:hypothetical protein n=1 Tax=Caballeronia glathei TaxID=60547 RepID=UPI0012682760|nr:hypothetical protein [Caballeronia glathei]
MAFIHFSDRASITLLVAPSRVQLAKSHERLVKEIRQSLVATAALAVAGIIGVVLLEFWELPDATTLGLQEILTVIVFATCTLLMYERGERKLALYSLEPADLTMSGEIRALLNRLPGGRAYQQAVEAEQRSFTTGELELLRSRARAYEDFAD